MRSNRKFSALATQIASVERLADVMKKAVPFFEAFDKATEHAAVEHAWTLGSDGVLHMATGSPESVEPADLPDGVRGLIDIHCHLDVTESQRNSQFINIWDMLGVFSSPARVFATAAVLVRLRNCSVRYVAACRPKPKALSGFLDVERGLQRYHKFFRSIEKANPVAFDTRMRSVNSLEAIRRLYAKTFPLLDFSTWILENE